jgi:hypothetical protein
MKEFQNLKSHRKFLSYLIWFSDTNKSGFSHNTESDKSFTLRN